MLEVLDAAPRTTRTEICSVIVEGKKNSLALFAVGNVTILGGGLAGRAEVVRAQEVVVTPILAVRWDHGQKKKYEKKKKTKFE